MTLEEYKNIIETSESDKEYICNWCKKNFYTEEQADDFAIDFAEWLRVNYYDNGDFWIAWDYDKDAKTSKELLKVYKKKRIMRKQSTLKELCYEYSEDESDCKPDKQPAADCLVRIFDEFAIEFAEWFFDKNWNKNSLSSSEFKKQLEIYKKEKGL